MLQSFPFVDLFTFFLSFYLDAFAISISHSLLRSPSLLHLNFSPSLSLYLFFPLCTRVCREIERDVRKILFLARGDSRSVLSRFSILVFYALGYTLGRTDFWTLSMIEANPRNTPAQPIHSNHNECSTKRIRSRKIRERPTRLCKIDPWLLCTRRHTLRALFYPSSSSQLFLLDISFTYSLSIHSALLIVFATTTKP